MHARARRRVMVGLGGLVVASVVLSACGGDAAEPLQAGAEAAPPSTAATSGSDPATTVPDPEAPTTGSTTTLPAAEAGPSPASPVEGLTAAELRTVVEAPASAAGSRRRGPVADRVVVGDRTVWRVTIPGAFTVLSSRVVVTVGTTDVGEGVVAADLASLVTVVTDPAPLVAGAPVAYRWGAGAPIAAGTLEVVR